MEDILAIGQIIARQPAVIATFLTVGTGLAVVGLMVTRRSEWPRTRRWALVAAGFAFAVLPATTLVRRLDQLRWQFPRTGELQDLVRRTPGLLPTTPENVLNLVMLVPFGFAATVAARRAMPILGIAVIAIVAVETLQGAAGIGVMSLPDAAHNLLGAAAGAGGGLVVMSRHGHPVRVMEPD